MKVPRQFRLMIALAIGTSFMSGATLHADARDKCEKRIHTAQKNLDKEVRKHGEHSRQAEDRRRELREAREYCRQFDRGPDHEYDHR